MKIFSFKVVMSLLAVFVAVPSPTFGYVPPIHREPNTIPSRQPSLTIVFRGLMVFHPDRADQYFEVGILPAPEHEFRMQLIEKSLDGVSSFLVPLGQYMSDKPDVWSLDFPSSTKGVTFYKGGSFDRKGGTGDNRELVMMLHVNGGEFYTKTTTLPLTRRKGDGTFEYFGRIAQEIATDVFLEDGDM